YTLLGSASIHPMARYVMKNAPYDPVQDFAAVARTARGPLVLVMNPRLPQTTLPAVVEAAKREPAKWSFATSSLGAAGHLGSIEFNRLTGANIDIVGYRGSAPALTDVAAGNAQLMFDPVLATLPMVRAGQLRGLGVATAARTPLAPDLPTLTEAGLPGFEFYSWYGVWAPRGVPVEILQRLNRIMVDGMRETATLQRLSGLGFEPVAETVDEAEAFIRADVARNADLLRLSTFQTEYWARIRATISSRLADAEIAAGDVGGGAVADDAAAVPKPDSYGDNAGGRGRHRAHSHSCRNHSHRKGRNGRHRPGIPPTSTTTATLKAAR
ncbi:MAG: Bug family tripartite tricarboxylate transporter substrate binding protein, partial [bacterium]